MKKIILFLLCSLAVPVAAGWDEYWRSPDAGVVYYLDASQLSRDTKIIRVPVKLEYREPIVDTKSDLVVTSGLINYEFDCKRVKYRMISLNGYSLPNLQGTKTLSTDDAPDHRKEHLTRWNSIEVEKHLKALMGKVCG
jgi:hypothetical protein